MFEGIFDLHLCLLPTGGDKNAARTLTAPANLDSGGRCRRDAVVRTDPTDARVVGALASKLPIPINAGRRKGVGVRFAAHSSAYNVMGTKNG